MSKTQIIKDLRFEALRFKALSRMAKNDYYINRAELLDAAADLLEEG
jgi:hypothetical protein